MSNGKVAVIKDPDTGEYSETLLLPTAVSILNFNGQVILGSPDTPPWKVFPAGKQDPFVVTLAMGGMWGEPNKRVQTAIWPKRVVAPSRMENRDLYRRL
jgi:hypothetical protein